MDSYMACAIYCTYVAAFVFLCAVAVKVLEAVHSVADVGYRRAVLRIVAAYAEGDAAAGERLTTQAARDFWRPRCEVAWDVQDVACFGKDVSRLSAGPL